MDGLRRGGISLTESELGKAFQTLSDALTMTETEITEEVSVIEQQIEELKDRIIQLNAKQDTLSHDKQSISEMFSRYATGDGAQS
jgi:chromosome segregation ATPase